MTILLDTGVLHGLLLSRDARHDASVTIVGEVMDGAHGQAFATVPIIVEAATLLRARRAPVAALDQLMALCGLNDDEGLVQLVKVIEVAAKDLGAVSEVQRRHWERGLSFTDCSTLHVMERDRIATLATFDKGFDGLVPVIDGAA